MTTQSTMVDETVLVGGAGKPELLKITIKTGAKLQEIVEVMAKEGGFSPKGAFLFIEDQDGPLNLELIVDEKYDRRKVHHVHRARTIEVFVCYGPEEKKRSFSPSTTIGKVLAWALKVFNIDPEKAPEMRLALEGSEEPLDNNTHIGSLVQHNHENKLKLCLVRPPVVNG